MNKVKKLTRYEGLLLAVPICLALLFNLHQPLLTLKAGLDPSFNYAVNEATLLHKSFGNNFISSYGPLGHLVSDYIPNFVIQASAWIFLSSVLLGVVSYLLTKKLYSKNSTWRYILSTLLVYAASIGSQSSPEWNYLVIFLLYGLLIMLAEQKKQSYFILLTLVASTFLFIKFTLGLAAIGIILLLPFARIKPQKNRGIARLIIRDYLLIISSYILLTFVFARLLHISNLLAYIKSGWIISSGFSQAMSYQKGGTFAATIICAIALIALLILSLLPTNRNIKACLAQIANFTFIVPALVVIWKYAVARQDAHIIRIVQVTLPLVVALYIVQIKNKNIFSRAIATVLALSVIVLTAISTPLNKMVFNKGFLSFVKQPGDNLSHANFIGYWEMGQEKYKWRIDKSHYLLPDKLPKDYTEEIGKNGVDVYPWETAVIEANHLNWDNRPSPFSFESYSPYFDNLNSDFFSSNKAPGYIVWRNYSGVYGIDTRNVLWDEPRTIQTILRTYELIKYNNVCMLLKKRSVSPVNSQRSVRGSPAIQWGVWSSVPKTDSNLFLAAEYNKGKRLLLEEALLRAETVSATLRYDNGSENTYRIVPENLGQGILVNDLPVDWGGIVNLFKGRTQDNVISIKFNSNPKYMQHAGNLKLDWFAEPN